MRVVAQHLRQRVERRRLNTASPWTAMIALSKRTSTRAVRCVRTHFAKGSDGQTRTRVMSQRPRVHRKIQAQSVVAELVNLEYRFCDKIGPFFVHHFVLSAG